MMFDFAISCLTNLFRIYLIYRFIPVFFDEEGKHKSADFFVCAGFFMINTMLFWVFHTAWINIACNLAGIGILVCLHTKSVKTNLFITGTIYLINMGCDVASTLLFIQYEDGQIFNQVYEIISVFLIMISFLLAGKLITIRKNAEKAQNTSLIVVPLCSIVVVWILIYLDQCDEVAIAVVALGMLFINFFMLYLYNQLLHFLVQKYETEMLRSQVHIYKNQLDVILQSDEKVKALRHDMKHHMNELKLLSNQYGIKEMQEYIDRMSEYLSNPNEIVSSGNVEIDSVLNFMLLKAKAELETVKVKVILPEGIKHSFDLNVLLGNVLENAIEAAKKTDEKYMKVSIVLQKGVLKIQIDNSYVAEMSLQREENGGNKIYRTTKENKDQHGIGLQNVKKIVEAYNGSMEVQTKGNIFSLKLLLYLSIPIFPN